MSVSDIIRTGTILFAAIKLARGRKPTAVDRSGEQAKIVFHEGDSIVVNVYAADLFDNPAVRQDVEQAVEPLKKPGIDVFRLQPKTGEAVEVTRAEVDYFRAPEPNEETLQDETCEEIVEVLAPHFTPGNKWQFALAGEGQFWAAILDNDFIGRVARHEYVLVAEMPCV